MKSELKKDEKKTGAESREEQKSWIKQRSQGAVFFPYSWRIKD